MDPIPKITRDSLQLGLHDTLPSSFRCFRLDSYSEMFFEEGRHLTRIVGHRCRWNHTLEYTFLVSVGLTPNNSSPNVGHVAYLRWEGKVLDKEVQATDNNLDGLLDQINIEDEAVASVAQRAYQSALIASGLMRPGLSVKFPSARLRAQSVGSANFRRALDRRERRAEEIRFR